MIGGPIEQAIQANVALVITQAVIIRLSMELPEINSEQPDVLINVALLLACIVAGGVTVLLYRVIRSMRNRTFRIISTLVSLAIQATAFQMLFSLIG
jgi:energy-converting hydrogenase Eha subunit A